MLQHVLDLEIPRYNYQPNYAEKDRTLNCELNGRNYERLNIILWKQNKKQPVLTSYTPFYFAGDGCEVLKHHPPFVLLPSFDSTLDNANGSEEARYRNNNSLRSVVDCEIDPSPNWN